MSAPDVLRVALCQLNLVVGDLDGNVDRMAEAYRGAERAGADLAVFPELAITGYPPEDLLLKAGFVEHSQRALERLASVVDGHCAAVVGWVEGHRVPGADPHDATDGPWNAAAVLHRGAIRGSYRKQALPNYGPFDEKRYFDPGAADQPLYRIAGVPVAVTVCEDMWMASGCVPTTGQGAALVVNLNASPFHAGKQLEREVMLTEHVAGGGCPVVYVNLVGGQDELVFDGGSVVVAADGSMLARSPRFEPSFQVVDVPTAATAPAKASSSLPVIEVSEAPAERTALAPTVVSDPVGGHEELWSALVLGVRDYVSKNGFSEAVIGLSGGVDSSIVAAIAVDALGPDRVHGVLMPSRYSSGHSVDDAVALSERLGIDHRVIAIEEAHTAVLDMLAPSFGGCEPDLTEENLQSRIRGVVLMALSNKFGWLVLTTGNKSETAVGYSTLYGDTAGGLAVIKDVPKVLVYELCRWRNERAGSEIVPESVLTKAPSAELRPDQRDDDSLPPYEILDPIIAAYVDGDMTVQELIEVGHDAALVERIARLVDLAEYKRRQGPPGIRLSSKAFGRDRRLPITNAYRGL
jgi:NAD+ synthase (glutamine-hydrolysing)